MQARSHLELFAAVRTLTSVRVWSPDRAEVESFARDLSAHMGFEVRAAESAEEAVEHAGLIVLATASERPVIQSGWVEDGAHVVSVGACRPQQREMDPALVARARLVVDSREAALVESGDVVMGIAEGRFDARHVAGELGEVAGGTLAGRLDADEVTIFKSLGQAVEDVAAGALVAERAEARRLGVTLEL